MKAIQNSQPSKSNSKSKTYGITYVFQHYILTHLLSLLRRLALKMKSGVLGLYSYNSLWRRSRTFNGHLNTVSVASLVLFVLLSVAVIIPIYNKVNGVEAATSEQAAPALTLNITNATANLDLVVSDNDGTFAKSNSNATFTVTTNNFTGYTLSIKSSSSSTDLSGSSGSFSSISSSMDSTTFDKSDHNGKWGYLPSKYNSSANTTTYYPSPNTTGNTIDSTSSANSTANSYTIGIGARADYSKPVGTYSNTYILTTVINSFSYSISYNKGNTTDTVTNLPTAQTATASSGSSVALSTEIPIRAGYTFNGWCSVMPTTNDDTDSCSGDIYDSGATYYFNKTTDNSAVTLYAIWSKPSYTIKFNANGGVGSMPEQVVSRDAEVRIKANSFTRSGYVFSGWGTSNSGTAVYYNKARVSNLASDNGQVTLYAIWKTPETWSSINYMQDMTPAICNSISTDTSKTLTDRRDSKTYRVTKLADGRCWMTQNLRIGGTSSIALTPYDSNVQKDFILTAQPEPDFSEANQESIMYNISSNTDYGGYYNWYTATAGTGPQSMKRNDQVNNAPSSLCPKSWRLPTGYYEEEYDTLQKKYGGTSSDHTTPYNNLRASPAYFATPGTYSNAKLFTQWPTASYISSSSWGTSRNYDLLFSGYPSSLNAYVTNTIISTGQQVRCINQNTYTISFDANGGEGEMAERTFTYGVYATLPKNNFTNVYGYSFAGWDTDPNSSEPEYADEELIYDVNTYSRATFYAIWSPAITYTLSYDANGGESAPQGTSITSGSLNPSLKVDDTIYPKRSGYSFRGYSTSRQSDSAEYLPGDTIALTPSSESVTLYAVWEKVSNLLTTISTMQQMSSSICAGTTTPTRYDDASAVPTATLRDSRDSNSYTVSKLADGQCWMTQNLRIYGRTLSSSTSNVTNNFTLPSSTSSWSVQRTSALLKTSSNSSYGTYYNWYAATAGTLSSDADICPKNWRLPTGGSATSEQGELVNAYGGEYGQATVDSPVTGSQMYEIFLKAPLNFVTTGYYSAYRELSLESEGSGAPSWSSTGGGQYANSLYIYPSQVNGSGGGNSDTGMGYPVRCLAK